MDPFGREPGTFEEWIIEHPYSDNFETELIERLSSVEEQDQGCVAIITEWDIYPELEEEIRELALRLWLDCYTVLNYRTSGGTPDQLRNFLRTLYYNEGIKGALLIELLPIAFYQARCFEGSSDEVYEEWPIDLFYMDLDGIWEDNFIFPRPNYQPQPGQDGIYDTHTDGNGDVEPEIFIGRLITGCNNQYEKIERLKNYFSKDFNYRYGINTFPPQVLVYVDDDWASHAPVWAQNMAMLYPEPIIVNDPEITRAIDYRERLNTSRAHVFVAVHSSSMSHTFYYNNHHSHESYCAAEYVNQNPPIYFYNFFACSFCRYTENNDYPSYGGGCAIFNNNGVGAIGSTKTGSMWEIDPFYLPLSQGKTMGDAFSDWFKDIAIGGFHETERDWYYGMTLLGDPFLKPKGHISLSSHFDKMTAYNNTSIPTIMENLGHYLRCYQIVKMFGILL